MSIATVILKTLLYFVYILEGLLIIRVIASWLPILNKFQGFITFIYSVTETFLAPIRVLIKKSILGGNGSGMMLDYAPFIALLIFNTITSMLRVYMVGL